MTANSDSKQRQRRSGDGQVTVRHQRRRLHHRDGDLGVAQRSGVLRHQRFERGEASQPQRPVRLAKKSSQRSRRRRRVVAHVQTQLRLCHRPDRLDRRQPRDLVLEPVQEQADAPLQVRAHDVTEPRRARTGARDGGVLHLLVLVRRAHPRQRRLRQRRRVPPRVAFHDGHERPARAQRLRGHLVVLIPRGGEDVRREGVDVRGIRGLAPARRKYEPGQRERLDFQSAYPSRGPAVRREHGGERGDERLEGLFERARERRRGFARQSERRRLNFGAGGSVQEPRRRRAGDSRSTRPRGRLQRFPVPGTGPNDVLERLEHVQLDALLALAPQTPEHLGRDFRKVLLQRRGRRPGNRGDSLDRRPSNLPARVVLVVAVLLVAVLVVVHVLVRGVVSGVRGRVAEVVVVVVVVAVWVVGRQVRREALHTREVNRALPGAPTRERLERLQTRLPRGLLLLRDAALAELRDGGRRARNLL